MRGAAFSKPALICTTRTTYCLLVPFLETSLQFVTLESHMKLKLLSLLIAAATIPASTAFAQTPAAPAAGSGQAPYVALFGTGNSGNGGGNASGNGGGTSTGAGNSTWFVDVARNQVVLCTQTGTGTGGAAGAQAFTCTAQPVPGTAPAAPAGTPAPAAGGGAAPAGAAGAGGAGANPMGS